jgi:hypothetical protein
MAKSLSLLTAIARCLFKGTIDALTFRMQSGIAVAVEALAVEVCAAVIIQPRQDGNTRTGILRESESWIAFQLIR